jgi:ABC-type branched-subunit amino acid transport system substrate-binding protein
VVLIFTSVRTNSVAIEITKAIQDKNTNDSTKIQVLGNMALSEQETIAKGGNYIDGLEVVKPCLSLKSDYMKKAAEEWTQKKAEINWRHATSYDAAQAFIQAIKMINESDSVQSKEINRKNILSQLKSSSFSVAGKDTSSGLELKWGKGEDHPNENAKYCLAKIKDGKFEDTDKF